MKTDLETQAEPVKVENHTENSHQIDKYILLGYSFLLVSFLFYWLCEYVNTEARGDLFTAFIVHYIFAVAYVVILLFNKAFGIRRSWQRRNIGKTIILLNLFLISAYALNRELPVFEDSTDWFCGYLLIISLTILSYQYFDILPVWINRLQYLLLGSAFVLYFYLVLFVANFYLIGSIGIIFFGIGGHVFVPLTLFIALIFLVKYNFRKKFVSYGWIIGGFLGTVLCVIAFVTEWTKRVSAIETLANQSVLYKDSELPIWVKVGQSVPNDWITQRILKSDLVYTTQKDKFGKWRFMPETVSWDEVRKHDPFVFLSTLMAECTLPAKDRVRILQTISDARHNANERLWSGDNLTTSYIISDVDIYPELRLSYTEKYLNVKNDAKSRGWWGNTEEAIYTFQLPEGSVVTSLSLWINGKEENGILTSKQKATNAYKTIVGVEQRDPSVVHWQEGNTVSVRIFPCTSQEERKFKIGVTSPLVERDGQILYKNITFRGPNPDEAKETIRIRFIGLTDGVEMPGAFKKDKNDDYVLEKEYDPQFEISLKAVPLKTDNMFIFDAFSYSIAQNEPAYQSLTVNRIYLDINNSWTSKEIEALALLVDEKQVFVYHDDGFIRLNKENWDLTDRLMERNFSLFPFHLLKETDRSLVVTKGKPLSPHLGDLKDSKFAQGISTFFATGKKVYAYNLGEKTSTYISSLRELRAFEFAEGDPKQLIALLNANKYPKTVETNDVVVLHDAKISISKRKINDDTLVSNAPDHLARLFAYNNIMRKVGASYFKNDFINESLVDEASSAYVVSPVSSLIVLESREDYERFGIHDKENSLHNASKQSSGAVPEPHEWALIILFILFVLYVKVRNTKQPVSL